ncbi:sulfotransferase family 2 domain-containing protein [Gluconobacter morbifer]|uniref:Sulfotransferase family protein n=1 Tax=Gluconobacter morbifer G707 TaxID=1088869 RepID=G6XMS4_9PROT|nr:sulfotransferase family 2 domain-containing protein [Gluconobacter morbifer]EHH66900.1 hypothetical protein GMO_27920 [Gluconobacter morbifer G707]
MDVANTDVPRAFSDAETSWSDPLWRDAWLGVAPHLIRGDKILLPEGNWPDADDVEIRTYRYAIDIADATVLFLYKARIAGISHAVLKKIYATWKPIFANEVFACFVRRGRWSLFQQKKQYSLHYRIVEQYLNARKLRRCKETVFFAHIPKTAGTTAWEAVATSVPSKLYCESYEALVCHPVIAANFDLVGGHVPLPILARFARSNDRFASILRDPLARFRSAFLHARRANEDSRTFTDSMRLMRETSLADFLSHPDAPMEICQQTIMLGFAFDEIYSPKVEQKIFDLARSAVEDEGNFFATTRRLPQFIDTMRTALNLPLLEKEQPARNVSDHIAQTRDIEEFEAFIPKIREMLTMERALYDLVARKEDR